MESMNHKLISSSFFSFLFSLALMAAMTTNTEAFNITEILVGFPDYNLYNSYLSQTKVSDEINSRQTLTCLVLNNSAMSSLTANHPLAAIKNALRLLTLLDYYDAQKLHDISMGTVVTTTLLQTTGDVQGNFGAINITDVKGGKVAFGSTVPGSELNSNYVKSVKQIPYNISVLEISDPIVFPGLLDAAGKSTANITALLENAGCKTFASIIVSSGVLEMYQASENKGLTVFAPTDEAFKVAGVPDLSKLPNADVVTLLQYHSLPQYAPKDTLKTITGPISTMVTNAAGKYDLTVSTSGDDVTLHTGRDSSRIASTVFDDTPFCILSVDNVLLPEELFGSAPAPAPVGVPPTTSPSPTPAATSPNPAPKIAKAPSPGALSPPAPPVESPDESPSGEPESANSKSEDKSAACGGVKQVGGGLIAALAVALVLILSI